MNGWLSTPDTAAKLGVTLRTLYKLIDSGNLVAYKHGRVIRVREVDVEAYLDGARIEAGSMTHLYPETKKKVEE